MTASGRWFRHCHDDETVETVTRLLLGYRFGVAYEYLPPKEVKKHRPVAEEFAELILSEVPPLPEEDA